MVRHVAVHLPALVVCTLLTAVAIIIIGDFCPELFSGLSKLAALYNVLSRFEHEVNKNQK